VALSWLDHWITTFWQEGFQIQVLHWLWHEVFFFSFILNKSYRLSRARRWLLDGNYWNMKLIQNLKISRTTPKPVVCTSFHFTTTFSQMKNSIPTKLISIRKHIYYNNWFFRNHLVKLNSMAFVFGRSWNSIACLNMCYLGSINMS
jgi:hypothetical protein